MQLFCVEEVIVWLRLVMAEISKLLVIIFVSFVDLSERAENHLQGFSACNHRGISPILEMNKNFANVQ